MPNIAVVVVAVCAVSLSGCEGMGSAAQSKTVQGAAIGSALGAGTGAIIGNQTDHAGAGTAIGTSVGALAGGLVGSALETNENKNQQEQVSAAIGTTKFCPVGGEIYSKTVKYCPNHGVELRSSEL
jgi:uncharacterized protein YcfJ